MTDASCESRQTLWRLSLLYAAAFLTLLLATHRLWLGSTGFPQVPAFRWLISAPDWVDAATAGIFLVGAAISGRRGHFWVAATAFVLVSACLNQHRLQVWAYHLSTAGLFATFSAPGRALPRLRWLTISIYAWSAVSKLDVGFAAGPGQTLLGGLAAAFQMNPPAGAFGKYGPWLMPIGELMTAVALAVPRWRRVGLWLSIAMHVLLLLAVGPLGLGHELGVQIWNVLFLVQNVILFRQRAETIATTADGQAVSTQPRADRLMGGLLAFVVVMPALQPWSFWDVWPSWAVYSTRGGWTTSFVHQDDIAKLPAAAQRFVREPPPLSDWHPIDVDAWSLSELHCPVYPQARFRLAVAAALSRSARIRVERRSAPGRLSGATTVETFDVSGGELPPEISSRFWVNTRSR